MADKEYDDAAFVELAAADIDIDADRLLIHDADATGVELKHIFVSSIIARVPGILLAAVCDEKTAASDGGTFTQDGWRTRVLNRELFDPFNVVSLASNQMTLIAGTYIIRAHAPAHRTRLHKTRLFDITNTAALEYGTSEFADDISASESEPIQVQTRSFVEWRGTFAVPTVVELQHYCTLTNTTTGFGTALGVEVEKYAMVEILRG